MTQTNPYSSPDAWHLPRPAAVFAAFAVVLVVVVGAMAHAMFGVTVAPVVLFVAISAVCLHGLIHSYPHDVLGACNGVTLVRMALVSLLAAAIFAPAAPWAVFCIAVVAFVSDGLDGWLARRAGLTSMFGARFDMEADALLGAILALILLTHGIVGPAILVLGFSRYVFVAAGWIWRDLQGDLPQSFRRKTICVLQIAALIALVCPLTPTAALPWIATIAATTLLYSFAVDARALMRQAA